MKVYIPENIDFGSSRKAGKYYYLISRIFCHRVFDKSYDLDDYVNLNAKILSNILGGRYKEHINDLLNAGIIECDDHYLVNEKSKGYRLTEQYANVKIRETQIHDRAIVNRYEQQKEFHQRGISSEQHKYLFKCLKKIEIDNKAAYNYLLQIKPTIKEFNHYKIMIELITEKTPFFTIDRKTGRVYTNITNLKRELRRFLSLNNHNLIEIDIANSQPFLFNVLINKYFHKIYPNTIYTPYGNQIWIPNSAIDDCKLYCELTSKGNFYEYFEQCFPQKTRDEIKQKMFGRIFFNNNSQYKYHEWDIFCEIFPTVANIISYYKSKDYKQLAILLQSAEADIIINSVVPILMQRKIYTLTIHDSILTLPQYVVDVKKIVLDVFKNKYNLTPTLKTKEY